MGPRVTFPLKDTYTSRQTVEERPGYSKWKPLFPGLEALLPQGGQEALKRKKKEFNHAMGHGLRSLIVPMGPKLFSSPEKPAVEGTCGGSHHIPSPERDIQPGELVKISFSPLNAGRHQWEPQWHQIKHKGSNTTKALPIKLPLETCSKK